MTLTIKRQMVSLIRVTSTKKPLPWIVKYEPLPSLWVLQRSNLRAKTRTHIFLSLCHKKSSSGLFSILIRCAILRHRLTAQAVGIRLRRREASHLQLTTARVRGKGLHTRPGMLEKKEMWRPAPPHLQSNCMSTASDFKQSVLSCGKEPRNCRKQMRQASAQTKRPTSGIANVLVTASALLWSMDWNSFPWSHINMHLTHTHTHIAFWIMIHMPGMKMQLWYASQNWIRFFFLNLCRSCPLCPFEVTHLILPVVRHITL